MTTPPYGQRPGYGSPQQGGPWQRPAQQPWSSPYQRPSGQQWGQGFQPGGRPPQAQYQPQQYPVAGHQGYQFQPGPTPQGPPFHQGQYPPSYPWPKPKKKSGSLWWIVLPLAVLALMLGYMALTLDGPSGSGGSSGGGSGPDPVPPAVDYVNEDYTVPGVGQGPNQALDPFDDPTLLAHNPLYEQPVPVPVRCEPAELEDVRDSDALQARMSDLSECLTRTYGPALEAAGFEPYQPRVLVYEGEGSSPCGDLEEMGAFFCSANQGIYMSADIHKLTGSNPTTLDYVMAHEYSHNVQGRNGILYQRYYEQEKAFSEGEAKEVNRRLEVQADCLAGTFMSSVTQSVGYDEADRRAVVDAARSVGDDQFLSEEELPGTHGVAKNRALWTNRGYDAKTYEECNSFVAPSEEVY